MKSRLTPKQKAQSGILHQMGRVGAFVGSNLRKLRFLLGCERNFHAPSRYGKTDIHATIRGAGETMRVNGNGTGSQ